MDTGVVTSIAVDVASVAVRLDLGGVRLTSSDVVAGEDLEKSIHRISGCSDEKKIHQKEKNLPDSALGALKTYAVASAGALVPGRTGVVCRISEKNHGDDCGLVSAREK